MLKINTRNNGIFITFEGIDGSGKTYQISKLKKKFKNYNIHNVIYTKEPDGTELGKKIKKLLMVDDSVRNISKETELLLMLAARNEHYNNIIKPFLEKKYIVICDRFIDSTFAYQCGNNQYLNVLYTKLNKLIINNFLPDLTLLMDINANAAIERIRKRKLNNKYDHLSKEFFTKTRKAYLTISNKNKRFRVIDASKDKDIIHQEVLGIIFDKMNVKI